MISEYIDILESFKAHNISVLLEQINTKIFEALLSSQFNPIIATYFINTNDEGLRAIQVNTIGPPFTDYSLDPDNVSQVKKLINALYFARLAFRDLEQINLRGKYITCTTDLLRFYNETIDKIYEAAYLLTHLDINIQEIFQEELRLVFCAITTAQTLLKPNDQADIQEPVRALAPAAHIASRDIDASAEEENQSLSTRMLRSFVRKSRALAQQNNPRTQSVAVRFKEYPLSYNIGRVTGAAIEQAKPSTGSLDTNALSHFAILLPKYISEASSAIEAFSTELVTLEPTLNNEQLVALKVTGLKLLADLEHLKGGHFFISLKFLKYIHIVRHIISLGMSALEQMGNFSESSQNAIRYNLAQLKYHDIPELFSLVDKIEAHCMLKPGTLSAPLMQHMKRFYSALIYYASKAVDFKAKGEELLAIEDSRFLSLRLEPAYKRIQQEKKNLFKIKKVQNAYTSFINLLRKQEHRGLTVHLLPEDTKAELRAYYKIINPFLRDINPELNECILSNLGSGQTWGSFFQSWGKCLLDSSRWGSEQRPTNQAGMIADRLNPLEAHLKKKINTLEFRIALNRQFITAVQQATNLTLFPYSENNYPQPIISSPTERLLEEAQSEHHEEHMPPPSDTMPSALFTVDESQAFSTVDQPGLCYVIEDKSRLIKSTQTLTTDQALTLAEWYRDKCDKFDAAREAYLAFIQLLTEYGLNKIEHFTPSAFEPAIKSKCRKLYNQFQPYFINGVPEDKREEALAFDRFLVHSLSDDSGVLGSPQENLFASLEEHFQTFFTQIDEQWRRKSRRFERMADAHFTREQNQQEFSHVVHSDRKDYVIKHTRYSEFIRAFRVDLVQILGVFNDSMLQELCVQACGIPFPELEELPLTTQSKQVRALKQLFNSFYHLEKILHQLEQLKNTSSKSRYAYHLIQAYNHLNEMMNMAKSLKSDPHFGLIGEALFNKAQYHWATIQAHLEPYQVSHADIPSASTLGLNPLWYTLNSFYIIPEHIRSIRSNTPMSKEERTAIHERAKKSALGIEAIINNAHSYFRLFLQTPNMISLYFNLKNKLREFIDTTHDAAINKIETFNNSLFLPMLLEADQIENTLGLKPGICSEPLRAIINEYYKGLLDSLKLSHEKHIQLICDKTILEERMVANEKNIERLTGHQEKLQSHFSLINRLQHLIVCYNNPVSRSVEITNELIQTYQKARPQLKTLKRTLAFSPKKQSAQNAAIDALLNENNDSELNNIQQLLDAGHAYFIGEMKTYALQIRTHKEKKDYLTRLKDIETSEHQKFEQQYASQSFKRQVHAFSSRLVGLRFTEQEYTKELKEYLLSSENIIINNAQTQEDMNASIREQLAQQVKNYQQDHLTIYHQLEAIQIALERFDSYFIRINAGSIFKIDASTDKEHKEHSALFALASLSTIANNKDLNISDRIANIKKIVQEPAFKLTILNQKRADRFSFNHFLACILSLLEALHIYTPERNVRWNELNTAVSKPPKIADLTKRYGLFTNHEHNKAKPIRPGSGSPALEDLVLPSAAPVAN